LVFPDISKTPPNPCYTTPDAVKVKEESGKVKLIGKDERVTKKGGETGSTENL